MSAAAWTIRRLHRLDAAQIDALASVLIDCVEGGASVSFMHPLTRERALAFWGKCRNAPRSRRGAQRSRRAHVAEGDDAENLEHLELSMMVAVRGIEPRSRG
jgi:hypothetical protein